MFKCSNCEMIYRKWLGRCTSCGNFNTLIEESETIQKKKRKKSKTYTISSISSLNENEENIARKFKTNVKELDRVLDGGITEGSVTLLGGEPGVGKSTLLLQIASSISKKILYISGEESISQIIGRAKRIGVKNENVLFMSETNIDIIEDAITEICPFMVIVDSIQTIGGGENNYTSGTVSTIRDVSSSILKICKEKNIASFLTCHITKEGSIAGPKTLEHMVDIVLYFEGDKNLSYRIIRAHKNRFGSTNEVGIFKMEKEGLIEIENPSEYMLSHRPKNAKGSVITCTAQGSRPILAEVQALVSHGTARRTVTGCDLNRAIMLFAVIEKNLGFKLSVQDIYINIAGGMKILEPSLDTAVIAAVSSSYLDHVIEPNVITFGEVGLSGEIRSVTHLDKRIAEAKKLGFTKCIVPEKIQIDGIDIVKVTNIKELLISLGM